MFKSSKKKLLVSGCSFSAHSYTITHKFPVWPEVLGKMLDMEVINLAQNGRGNEFIYSTILDCLTKENNIGLVVAMWSESNRIDFEVPHRPETRRTRPYIKEWSSIHTIRENDIRDKFWKDVISDCFNEYNYNQLYARTKKSMRFMYTFQEMMKSKNLNYLQIMGCGLEPRIHSNELGKLLLDNIYFDLIDEKYFVGWPISEFIGGYDVNTILKNKDPSRTNIIDASRISDDDGISWREKDPHPNKLGHEQIAEVLYDAYKKVYDVS